MKLLLIILNLISVSAFAVNECSELKKCIEHVSKITGKKYIYDSKNIRGGITVTPNMAITAENADTLLSYFLDLNEYARIPTSEKDTYSIIRARDIRYNSLPSLTIDAQALPQLPQNSDFYSVTFMFKNFKQGQLHEAIRAMRPLTSKYGRIIENNVPGSIVIQDKATKISTMSVIIKGFDRELSKEEIEQIKEKNEERKRSEELAIKNEKKD